MKRKAEKWLDFFFFCGRNPGKQIDTAGFDETLQSFWVHHLLQRKGQLHLLMDELRLFMFWGVSGTVLQVLLSHVRRQSNHYLSSPTDQRHFAMLPLRSAFLLICGSFVKNCPVLRDADNEHVSRCWRCCCGRQMWLLFCATILINWSIWVQCNSLNKLPSIHKHKGRLFAAFCVKILQPNEHFENYSHKKCILCVKTLIEII